jgi:hypothetical protein
MSVHKMTKAVFSKVHRSELHHLMTPVFPQNYTLEAGFDVLGVMIVISLSAAVMLLMRLIVGN